MRYLLLLVAFVDLATAQRGEGLIQIYPDYTNHPCKRDCNGRTTSCTYYFTADRYFTMKPDCMNCINGNVSACLNPQCIPGDGRQRMVTVINGMLPGPTIEVCQGDQVIVYLENLLDPETVTIHWHGIEQRGTQYMDGVPGVTQCPIQPFTTFMYKFIAREPGTHFWHSHSSSQRADGLFGPLIVKKPKSNEYHRNLYDLDVHRMSLIDWFLATSTENFYKYQRTLEFFQDQTSTILVNGFGPMPNTTLPGYRFVVRRGLRYRFRVINAANVICPMSISIDNHRITLISSDGQDFQPVEVDSFQLGNGERYDFILNANQPINEYRIRITGDMECNLSSYGVLHYDGAGINRFQIAPVNQNGRRINCINQNSGGNCINYDQLRSVQPLPRTITREPDFKYFFGMDLYSYVKPRYQGVRASELATTFINEIAYVPAGTPLLLDPEASSNRWCNYENKPRQYCNGTFCECLHLIEIPQGALVEFIFVDFGVMFDFSHPMHLHGNNFWVIGQQRVGSSVNIETIRNMDRQNRLQRNFENPIKKDTAVVPDGGYLIVRYINDNPGYWFLHCHVDFHTEEGMGLVIRTPGPYSVPSKFPQCGDYLG